MDLQESFDAILADGSLDPDAKQERINLLLTGNKDGARFAQATIGDAKSEIPASFAANWLAVLPGLVDEKNGAMRQLIARHPEWSVAIANLVKFADDDTFEALVRLSVTGRPHAGDLSIAYELALNFPDRMRQYRQELERFDVFDLLLPGAPDDWVKDLFEKYRRDESGNWAVMLSYVRTDAARDALITLLNHAPSGRQDFLAALVESSGVFVDTREASTYEPTYVGYFADPSASRHLMGGVPDGLVPMGVDKKTSERILELRRAELPFEIGGKFDPLFFWHEGRNPPGHIYTRVTDKGRVGLMTLMGDPANAHELVTVDGSAVWVEERHPFGLGGAAVAGMARIQLGGYPQWRTPERFPRCPTCRTGMKFLASVDSGITALARLAFDGILYAFWCETCDVACTRRQL